MATKQLRPKAIERCILIGAHPNGLIASQTTSCETCGLEALLVCEPGHFGSWVDPVDIRCLLLEG